MPPKKSTTSAKPASSKTTGPTYEDMIKDALLNLKDRKGSSRVSLKKYVKANNKTADGPTFDKLFNNALSKGVAKGIFAQPKGASGGVKLAAKPKPTAATKPTSDKPTAKPASTKKVVAPKKATTIKKAIAPKKAATPKEKKAATTKEKAPVTKKAAPKKAAPKKAAPAPAVEDKPVVLGKTKGGRVTKTTPKSTIPKVKKAPAKKATPKKTAAPTA